MTGIEYTLEDATDLLSRTPPLLSAWFAGLPDRWVHAREGDGTWSAFDIVGHLIHGEYTDWIPRATTIMEHGESRPFAPFDRFAMLDASGGKTMAELLAEFERARGVSLDALKALDIQTDDLRRTGIHPEFGVVTLGQHLSTWVAHDQSHIAQIARVLARQYAGEVGPWRAYLGPLR